jgi:FkbM family methyltransferase
VTVEFTPRDEVQWRQVKYLKSSEVGPERNHKWEYELILPEPLASWDVFAKWERARVYSMRDNLTHDDILFDVGTEQGWCNLVYAHFVGVENIFLIEPTPEFWPNIQATWQKNFTGAGESPCGMYAGLLSNKTTDPRASGFNDWPAESDGPLIDRNKYQLICENESGAIPEMTLDDLVERSGVVPTAITMDVEGAELLVLEGAAKTLVEHHPKCWISVHPDLMERHYGVTANQVHTFMAEIGYVAEHLSTDHEEHWLYQ